MKQTTVTIIILAFTLSTFGGELRAATESASQPTVIFTLEQSRTYRESGACISPDAKNIVYVGAEDNALHVVELATRHDRQVLTTIDHGLDVFDDPSFSPDGNRIIFSASGGTRYYPSDIYSVQLDGAGLLQLTTSKPAGGNNTGTFAEYFYEPKYSPDGSEVLAWRYDGPAQTDSAVLMSSSGAGLRVLTSGKPLF
jgi:Tol biopolymer transport system component